MYVVNKLLKKIQHSNSLSQNECESILFKNTSKVMKTLLTKQNKK